MSDGSTERLAAAVAAADAEAVLAALAADTASHLRRGDVDLLRRAAAVVAPDDGPLPAAVAWRLGYALHQDAHFLDALEVYARADVSGADPVDIASPARRRGVLAVGPRRRRRQPPGRRPGARGGPGQR